MAKSIDCPGFDGRLLARVRKERKLTQKALADGICTYNMISLAEANRARPSVSLLQKISSRLGVPIETFISTSEENNT